MPWVQRVQVPGEYTWKLYQTPARSWRNCKWLWGVKTSFALQTGREIRIMVSPEEVKDDKLTILAHDIREKIGVQRGTLVTSR